ncbi:MAG: glycine cleavage system aminomethyltransferase GcvT [Balneolaceae bacterium]
MAKQTPLYSQHLKLDAKMTDFGGFEMPVQYSGIKEEHRAVRERAGLFDVSHMGELYLSGPEAEALLQYVTVNDVSILQPGQAQYTLLCNEQGGIVDDLLIYKIETELFMLVVNASNTEKDKAWIQSRNTYDAALEDRSGQTALIALQGPAAEKILNVLSPSEFCRLPGFHFGVGRVAGEEEILVSATGYTGEKGYELYLDIALSDPVTVWEQILKAGEAEGLLPAGLGARDTLRLEMGYPLYGNDLNDSTTPFEAGLGWVVKLGKGQFVGKEALQQQKQSGITRVRTGFIMESPRAIPRAGYEIYNQNDEAIGEVTSGSQSVTLGRGIGMGYISTDYSKAGGKILISIRSSLQPATIQHPPFLNKQTG